MNDGGPAFPTKLYRDPDGTLRPVRIDGSSWYDTGMSLRDYFAAQALAGRIASGGVVADGDEECDARKAYRYADAMLAQRTR